MGRETPIHKGTVYKGMANPFHPSDCDCLEGPMNQTAADIIDLLSSNKGAEFSIDDLTRRIGSARTTIAQTVAIIETVRDDITRVSPGIYRMD